MRVSRLGEFCMGVLQQVVAELHEWRKGLPVARIHAAWGGGWRWHAGPDQGGQRLLGFAGLVEHPGIRMFVDHDVLGDDRRAVGPGRFGLAPSDSPPRGIRHRCRFSDIPKNPSGARGVQKVPDSPNELDQKNDPVYRTRFLGHTFALRGMA